jgi:sugar phosphate permease
VLTAGLLLDSASLALFTQLPVDGHYFWNLFPGMLVGGIGLGLSFVPMTIAGLTGVSRADAGVASGLINTSRQVGGAVGLAAVSTIASAYAKTGSVAAVSDGLTQGFHVGFLALSVIALLGALISAVMLAPQPDRASVEAWNDNRTPLEEAA